MARTLLPERLQVKLSEVDKASLAALSDALRIDQSSVIRLLIAEKCRTLGITVAPAAPAAKKRRRARA